MSMLTFRNTLLGVLALTAVLTGFRYIGGRHPATGTKTDAAAPVSVALVERRDMPVVVHALGTGMGADSRRPLGLCVAGGLVFSQLLTLYITPVLYTYLEGAGRRFRHPISRKGGSEVGV